MDIRKAFLFRKAFLNGSNEISIIKVMVIGQSIS